MASEKILESKKAKVAALTEKLQNSVSFVLVDYKGITVEEDTKLRKELREAGVSYTVEKNSMLRFALKEMGIVDSFEDVLHGTTAIAVSNDDQTAAARILGKFAESKPETFNLKVMALSKIPSKDVLLAQLVGSLQGPLRKLAATLQALADKKNEEEAA